MKILYCDCYSGISGDMFLAAMLDAGYPLEDLEKVFSLIELPEYQKVSFRKVQKGAVSAGQVTFVLREDPHHHTGDLIHGHSHRSFADIRKLITGSNLPESIVAKSLRIFVKIAQAESSVHNVPVDEVHFHEVVQRIRFWISSARRQPWIISESIKYFLLRCLSATEKS